MKQNSGYLVPYDESARKPKAACRGKIKIDGKIYSLQGWDTPSDDGGNFLTLRASLIDEKSTAQHNAEQVEKTTALTGRKQKKCRP